MKKKRLLFVFTLLFAFSFVETVLGAVPAAPVMTLYRFNGELGIPYYKVEDFIKQGTKKAAGHLSQGSSVIPCIVVRDGKPLTNKKGTPYVGFEIVVDSKKAKPASVEKMLDTVVARENKMVDNHHCDKSVKYVIEARKLINRKKPPFFDPPGKGEKYPDGVNESDRIVRAFHNSAECAKANKKLTGRRSALANAWEKFISKNSGKWAKDELNKAKHLDYVMRTAMYEGHLGRGCNAYGACERNIIALSIRNRVTGQCLSRQGCKYGGDFQGASSSVSQYNIWDEYLTQVSGLTACFLRADLKEKEPYMKLQGMYTQSVGDVSAILFGSDAQVRKLFPGVDAVDLKSLRHYYHPPAMGACYPKHDRVEYISAAVASKGSDHILIANKRIKVGNKKGSGYLFKDFIVSVGDDGDSVDIIDRYKGFVIDGRKVALGKSSRCTPYGVSTSCRFSNVGRYRKTPFWLKSGKPVAFKCSIEDRGESCSNPVTTKSIEVGGRCDVDMMPVSGVK